MAGILGQSFTFIHLAVLSTCILAWKRIFKTIPIFYKGFSESVSVQCQDYLTFRSQNLSQTDMLLKHAPSVNYMLSSFNVICYSNVTDDCLGKVEKGHQQSNYSRRDSFAINCSSSMQLLLNMLVTIT